MQSFLSPVKAKARHYELAASCGCGRSVDYTDQITIFILVASLSDLEIQENLLSLDDLTFDAAETKAVAKEAVKFNQVRCPVKK